MKTLNPHEVARQAEAPRNNPHLAAQLETIDQGVGMIRDKLRELGLSDQTPDYPPTYAGMVEHLRDDPSTENYRFFTTVVCRSRNLTRQGRANVLRDLRDAMRQ